MYTHTFAYHNKIAVTQLVWDINNVTLEQLLSFWNVLSQPNAFHQPYTILKLSKKECNTIKNFLQQDISSEVNRILKQIQCSKDETKKLKAKDRLLTHLVAKSIGVKSTTIKEAETVCVNCTSVAYYSSLGKAVREAIKGNEKGYGLCGCDLIPDRIHRKCMSYLNYDEERIFQLRYDIPSYIMFKKVNEVGNVLYSILLQEKEKLILPLELIKKICEYLQ